MIKKLLLVLSCLPLLMLSSPLAQSVFARSASDQGISLQISPLPIELAAKPGASTTSELSVRNAGSQDETLQVRLLKVSADDNGTVRLSNPGPSDEFVNWVHFSKTVFEVPPGAWQSLTMTIDLPPTAAFGYYFAVEYLRAQTQAPQPGKAVAQGAVATFVLLNAEAPGTVRQAQIVNFSANKKLYEFLPAGFSVKVRSTGNVHVAPHGNIFILKGSKQISSIQVNSALGNVLPGSSRFFTASWSDGFPVYENKYNGDTPVVDKNGKPVSSLKWDFSKANHLRFGHYTAHLVLAYDDGQRDVPLEAYVGFWVIPWRLIFYALVIILGPVFLVYLTMRWRFKERLEKERTRSSHAK